MTSEEYTQMKAFAKVDGLYLALVWIGSFACYVYGLTSPLTSMCGMIAAVASPFFAAKRLKKYRDEVVEGVISFRRAMFYYITTFMYASLIFAMAQLLYFQFIDNGYLAGEYTKILTSPEAKTVIEAYGMTQTQTDEALAAFRETTPIMIAANIMAMNLMAGVVLSVPMAAWAKKTVKL